jgi:hypothetical protein
VGYGAPEVSGAFWSVTTGNSDILFQEMEGNAGQLGVKVANCLSGVRIRLGLLFFTQNKHPIAVRKETISMLNRNLIKLHYLLPANQRAD